MKKKDMTIKKNTLESRSHAAFLAVCFLTTMGFTFNVIADENLEEESVSLEAAEHRGTGPYVNLSGSSSATFGQGASSAGPGSKGLSASVQVISATGAGVYTVPGGVTLVEVECIAGGGGSGGGAGTTLFASAGGGSGSYSKKVFTPAQLGATVAYIVGTGGTAGASGGGAGSTGAVTTFGGTLVTTNGGAGSATASAAALAGGAGGALGTGGIFAGNSGGSTIASMTLGMSGAAGADSFWGQGGFAVPMATGPNGGKPGQGYGAGASGGTAGESAPAAFAGGAGAPGAIIITEYYLV